MRSHGSDVFGSPLSDIGLMSLGALGRQHFAHLNLHATGLKCGSHCVCRRYPQYNAVRFTFTLLFAFLLATAFWRVGMHRCAYKSSSDGT